MNCTRERRAFYLPLFFPFHFLCHHFRFFCFLSSASFRASASFTCSIQISKILSKAIATSSGKGVHCTYPTAPTPSITSCIISLGKGGGPRSDTGMRPRESKSQSFAGPLPPHRPTRIIGTVGQCSRTSGPQMRRRFSSVSTWSYLNTSKIMSDWGYERYPGMSGGHA